MGKISKTFVRRRGGTNRLDKTDLKSARTGCSKEARLRTDDDFMAFELLTSTENCEIREVTIIVASKNW